MFLMLSSTIDICPTESLVPKCTAFFWTVKRTAALLLSSYLKRTVTKKRRCTMHWLRKHWAVTLCDHQRQWSNASTEKLMTIRRQKDSLCSRIKGQCCIRLLIWTCCLNRQHSAINTYRQISKSVQFTFYTMTFFCQQSVWACVVVCRCVCLCLCSAYANDCLSSGSNKQKSTRTLTWKI